MPDPPLSPGERRIAAAFAEAMLPASATLPGAEAEVAVEAGITEMLSGLPPRHVRAIRAGVRAFDLLPFPRRFSKQTAEERRRLLAEWVDSRNPFRRELTMLMKTLATISYVRDQRVREAIGYEMRCAVDGAQPPEPEPLGELEPAGAEEDCDVVIVGSGAGGAPTAAILAEAGLEVIVLEAGPHMSAGDYPADPVDALARMYRDGGLTLAEGAPPIPIPNARLVGGTTVVNSGTCFRTPEHVLAAWPAARGQDWVSALEPEYEAAERMLAVTPVDPGRMGRNGALVAAGAEALGLEARPLARNAGRCVQCSACFAGCPIDAKRGMHVSYLPRAVAAGARIRSGTDVREIIFEGSRASGVEALAGGLDGAPRRRYRVNARKAVIVAGGAFGTPALLLRSGLRHPAIGRNLRIHPATGVGARFREPVRGWDGVMQSFGIHEWERAGIVLEATFTPLALGAQWLPGTGQAFQRNLAAYENFATNGIQLRDLHSSGRISLRRDGSLRIGYRLHRSEADKLTFAIARTAEIWFAAGAEEVFPAVSGVRSLRAGEIAAFERSRPRPERLRLEGFHPLGTAAFGTDPGRAAVDPLGAVRGAGSLYVADASLLPGAPGVNPMMTIIALAAHNARALAERLP